MIVTYFGERCFRVESGSTSFLIDPVNNRLKADVTLLTSAPPLEPNLSGTTFSFPGEYEASGIEVLGWPLKADSSEKELRHMFMVNWEDIHFVFLGEAKSMPPADLMDEWGRVDLLFIPIGEKNGFSVEEALRLVKQVEPALVLPYGPKLTVESMKKIGTVEEAEKLVFKKKELEDGRAKVVILKEKN